MGQVKKDRKLKAFWHKLTARDSRNVLQAITTLDTNSLWDQAYNALRIDNSKLVEKYEKLLSRELSTRSTQEKRSDLDETINAIDGADLSLRQSQLDHIIKSGLKRVEERRTTYHIAGQEFVVQEQVAQAAELLEWTKEWIDSAVQSSPQASIAWAAICIALPFLTKPAAAEQANREGFSYVTARMKYYVSLEPLMLPPSKQPEDVGSIMPSGLRRELGAHVVELYKHILDYQIRSVLRFYRGSFKNFGRDIGPSEDWKDMRSKIEYLERVINNDLQQTHSFVHSQMLEAIAKDAEKVVAVMQELFTVSQKHLQVGEGIRDISAKQLLTQEAISSKMTSKEEACHQIFRVTDYEWYKNRIENRIEGTCEWLVTQPDFRTWLENDAGVLLISADPGCGKSVLTKYLVDCVLPRSNAETICYFFFKDQIQNTLKQALCSLLHQLFCAKPGLIQHAMLEYSQNGSDLAQHGSILWKILTKATQDSEAGSIIFVLDALDECVEQDLETFVDIMGAELRSEGFPTVRFLLTTRPYEQITSQFAVNVPCISIPGEDKSDLIREEINHVIKYRTRKLAREKALKEEIREHLEQRLLQIEHRTYLWVYLVFDHLKQGFKKTKKDVGALLDTLPENVSQAYDKDLSKSGDEQKVRKILSIILAAQRPLTVEEMNVAVNVELSDMPQSYADLDLEEEQDFKTSLRRLCGLFVSIYQGRVHFLHQTAREYLLPGNSFTSSSRDPLVWQGSITQQQAHAMLSNICIAYINFQDFDDDNLTYDSKGYYPFLDYSTEYWHEHYRQSQIENQQESMQRVIEICDTSTERCELWLDMFAECEITGWNVFQVACVVGLETVAMSLVQEQDLDLRDKNSRSALHLAALHGQESIVQLLLDSGANVNAQDRSGDSALSVAVEEDYVGVMRLLLKYEADPNLGDPYGRAPLHQLAANRGIESNWRPAMQLLLNNGADIELRDFRGSTPLLVAVEYGQPEIVQLLIDNGASVFSKDRQGDTALHYAALWHHQPIVRLLLDHEADIDARTDYGKAPLDIAIEEGDEDIVNMLQQATLPFSSGEL